MAVVLETDVSLGKPRDFGAFQSFLSSPIESLSLFWDGITKFLAHTFLTECRSRKHYNNLF